MNIIQILILVLSGTSIFFFANRNRYHYGFIFGLFGQPLWFYATYQASQWGMFILSFWFTFHHARGLYNHTRKLYENNPREDCKNT